MLATLRCVCNHISNDPTKSIATHVTRISPIIGTAANGVLSHCSLVEELRGQLGWYCAHLSTSMKFDTDVDQNILNSFFEGAKAGAHWGRHNRKIQYGSQPILDFVITS